MTTMAPEFTRTVVHYLDMPCLIEPGDTTSPKRDDVTCASCIAWLPVVPGRCQHERIALMGRHFDKEAPSYRWNCGACGYKTSRLADGVPAMWWRNSMDNPERKQTCDAQYDAWKAKR